jgi:glucose/arabinose dehydrogenase
MLRLLISTVAIAAASCGQGGSSTPLPPDTRIDGLRVETIATGLDTPWDLAWGPDGMIWFSERAGHVSRLDPATGQVTRAGDVAGVAESGEGGLMGIAFHPDFASTPIVYAAHTYSTLGGPRNRLVRMRWDGTRLGAPETLLDGIPGGSIHDGSRLAIGPDRLLYMTTGDAGDGDRAQDPSSLAGKILRLGLDGRPAPGNPSGSAVWTLGHRNPQGIAFSPTGALYVSEHGPGDNDEVNRIEAGRNYGWPTVHGFCDDDAGSERAFCQAHAVVEPLAAWTPTIAPSGLAYYDASRFPGWKGSLLFTTLKGSALRRLQLTADGARVASQETLLAGQLGRLRDVLVGPDGALYLATSNRDGRGNPREGDDRIVRVTP